MAVNDSLVRVIEGECLRQSETAMRELGGRRSVIPVELFASHLDRSHFDFTVDVPRFGSRPSQSCAFCLDRDRSQTGEILNECCDERTQRAGRLKAIPSGASSSLWAQAQV